MSSSSFSRRTRAPKQPSENDAKEGSVQLSPQQLTQDALELLRQFLMYLDPAAASQLPLKTPENAEVPIPISEWNVIYRSTQPTAATSSIKVSSYPSPSKNLFCVESVLPGISARQFWTLMAESGNRHLWDSTVQEGGNFRWCQEELERAKSSTRDVELAKGIAARIEYLRMGAIFMVAKPRDMVLLSADVRLPPSSDSSLRMVSSCRSEVDAEKPAVKGYTRWSLGVGGFMVEELGSDGLAADCSTPVSVRVTQLSDLGELASWVPSSIVKMVASTMVPRSLNLIYKVASSITPPQALKSSDAHSGFSLREEEIVKGKERWSKARGIPLQIGTGVLRKESKHQPASLPVREEGIDMERTSKRQQEAANLDTHTRATNELPSGSLSIQRLSTSLSESTSSLSKMPPKGATVQAGDSHGCKALDSASATSDDTASLAHRVSSGPQSPPTSETPTLSVPGTLLTLSVPSGEATVPGSIDDVSSHRGSSIAPSTGSIESSEDVRFLQSSAPQLDERLQKISKALMEQDIEGVADNATALDLCDRRNSANTVTTRSESSPTNDEEEVRSILAEALSISLGSPSLLPQFAPQSPKGRTGSRRGASVAPFSPSRVQARREASELSTLLLAGSDALVTALAPAARETIVSTHEDREIPRRHLQTDSFEHSAFQLDGDLQEGVEAEQIAGAGEAVESQDAQPFHVLFSGSRRPAQRSSSSYSTRPIAVTSRASVQQRSFSYSARSSVPDAESDVHMKDNVADNDPASRSTSGSWARGLKHAPYALALGMMAMMWATTPSAVRQRGRSGRRKAHSKASTRDGTHPEEVDNVQRVSGESSAAVQAARKALLRSHSTSKVDRQKTEPAGEAGGKAALSQSSSSAPTGSQLGQSDSESLQKYQAGGHELIASHSITSSEFAGSEGGSAIRIPDEDDEQRQRSRANYGSNPKLMTCARQQPYVPSGAELEQDDGSGWASWIGSYIKSS